MMLAAILLAAALHAVGPGGTVAGRVVRVVAGDTVAAAGAMVVLHGITPTVQGPVDSVRSDAEGRFRLRAPADTATILLVSARWGGIEYFSVPLDRGSAAADTPVQVVVADTSTAAPVALLSRHLVIGAPAADGTRNAVDLFILANTGTRTRVAVDSVTPTWRLVLPPNVANVVIGESDFADDVMHLHGDTLELTAAIPPGQRQILVNYQVPPATRRMVVPYGEAAPLANILLEEDDAEVVGVLARADTASVDGRRYTRWSGSVAAGGSLELRFGGAGRLPGWVMEAVAGAFALALIVMALLSARAASRGTPGATAVAASETPVDRLLDAIARLDAEHAGRASELPPDAWQAYLAERERLKDEVRRLLPS
jgi:hypothetical protein